MSFVFDTDAIGRLYPAYIHTDEAGVLVACGPSVARRVPGAVPGAALLDLFEAADGALSHDPAGRLQAGERVQLHSKAADLSFVGSVVRQPGGLLFCLNHAPSNLERVEALGLDLSDFAPGDTAIAGLILISLQKALLKEAQDAVSELAVARDTAVAGLKTQAEFLANVSHELRTPLTGLAGFTDLLQELPDLPAPARTYAQRIGTATAALTHMVNDVLDYSALEAGKIELDIEPFEPEAIHETVRLFEAEAAAKGLALSVEAAPGLPPRLLGDRRRIGQIVSNLVSNAVKFTPAGRVDVRLGYTPDRRLRLEVEDTGPGVSPEQRQALFGRFVRLDNSSTRHTPGAGLGLAISKSLAGLMNGDMGMTPASGGGALFWFEAPLPSAEAAPLAAPAEPPRPRTRLGSVLVVDDSALSREFVRAALQPICACVITAPDGGEALRRAGGMRFDLMILDVHMPQVDGVSLIRALREGPGDNADAPVLVLSGDVTSKNVAACLEAGAKGFLAKPVAVSDLLAAARALARDQAPAPGPDAAPDAQAAG